MTQHHIVVFYDTDIKEWDIDYDGTETRFPEGAIWDDKREKWINLNSASKVIADVDGSIYNSLNTILEGANNNSSSD